MSTNRSSQPDAPLITEIAPDMYRISIPTGWATRFRQGDDIVAMGFTSQYAQIAFLLVI